MITCSRWIAWLVAGATLCGGVALAEGGAESDRYYELAESEAAFASALGAHRRGDHAAAERGYLDAIARDPAFVEAIVNLARVHIARGELTGAAGWLERAARGRPDYPGIDAARGLLALAEGDVALAVEALGRARSRLPRDVEVLSNLAAGLITQTRSREAIKLLDEVERLEPGRADTSFNLALAHDHMGDRPRAVHYYQRFLSTAGPADPQRAAVAERIEVLIAAGSPERGAPQIRLHSTTPVTTTRSVAKGG